MEKELPKGWILIQLGDLFLIERGGSPRPIEDYITQEEDGINWIKIGDTKGLTKYIYKTKEKIKPEGLYKSRMVYEDDFILSNSMSFGRPYIMKTSGCIHDGWLVIRPNKKIVDLNYLYYILSSTFVYQQFSSLAKGSTVKNLNIVAVQQVYIYLPPLPEQQRIVAKLDTLFGHLDALKTRLDRIPQLLKDFRQKVLTQAVTGKLTEEWREGKELEEWKRTSLENIAGVIDPHPSHRTPPELQNGVPYVSIKDVSKDKQVTLETARKVSWKVLEEHKNRYTLRIGDFVFGKIGTIGRPIILPDFEESPYTLSANIILIQPNEEFVKPYFMFLYFDSPGLMEEVMSKSSATSQSAFGIKKMRDIIVPIPPLEEQQEIVRRVESLFAKADRIEANYQKLKAKIEQLPQAMLAKAFRGELVAQLPTDGDARDLLEEIKKAKEGLEKGGKSRKMNEPEVNAAAEPGGCYERRI